MFISGPGARLPGSGKEEEPPQVEFEAPGQGALHSPSGTGFRGGPLQ